VVTAIEALDVKLFANVWEELMMGMKQPRNTPIVPLLRGYTNLPLLVQVFPFVVIDPA